jgi:hypothetical protein
MTPNPELFVSQIPEVLIKNSNSKTKTQKLQNQNFYEGTLSFNALCFENFCLLVKLFHYIRLQMFSFIKTALFLDALWVILQENNKRQESFKSTHPLV